MKRLPIMLAVVSAALAGEVAGKVYPSSVPQASSRTAKPVTRKEARRAFEAEWGMFFQAKKPLAARFYATDAAAFGKDESEWICALPLEDGTRLRFLRVTLRDGAFVCGTLHYLGLPAMTLTAEDYAGLRRDFPLVAVPVLKEASPEAEVRLLAPASCKLARPIPPEMRTGLAIRPFDALFGDFLEVVQTRLRVKTDKVSFRVVHLDAQGVRLELGTLRNVRGERELDDRKVLDAVGAAFPKLVSDRARTDWFVAGSLAYEIP